MKSSQVTELCWQKDKREKKDDNAGHYVSSGYCGITRIKNSDVKKKMTEWSSVTTSCSCGYLFVTQQLPRYLLMHTNVQWKIIPCIKSASCNKILQTFFYYNT